MFQSAERNGLLSNAPDTLHHVVGRGIEQTPRAGVTEAEWRSGSRPIDVVRARRLFGQVAVKSLRPSGAAVARCLGVTPSAVNRLAVSEELREVKRVLNAL